MSLYYVILDEKEKKRKKERKKENLFEKIIISFNVITSFFQRREFVDCFDIIQFVQSVELSFLNGLLPFLNFFGCLLKKT